MQLINIQSHYVVLGLYKDYLPQAAKAVKLVYKVRIIIDDIMTTAISKNYFPPKLFTFFYNIL